MIAGMVSLTAPGSPSRTGGDVFAAELAHAGVEVVFCITGAGNLALVDAIHRRGDIRLIYVHHEQAAVMAAQGYSRVTGGLGVSLVTTGGGAANAVIGALSAQLDSVPILLIAGNESSYHCESMTELRAYGVQGFDSVSVYKPITKSSERIWKSESIRAVVRSAIACALEPRAGVSFVEFPMDLQRAPAMEPGDAGLGEVISTPVLRPSLDAEWIAKCWTALCAAERPLLYFGDGIRYGGSRELALQLIDLTGAPCIVSWSGLDLLPDSHPQTVGRVGLYGDRAANILLQKSDFLLCVGTRLAIPQMGYDQDDFARHAERWVVDVDSTELSKFRGDRWHLLQAESKRFLSLLNELAVQTRLRPQVELWRLECDRVWAALPREAQVGALQISPNTVHSYEVIAGLNAAIDDDAIVVTDVGAGLLTGHYGLRPRGSQRVFTSQGLGEMGFGLPAAIGACFAAPDRQVVCLDTDGALMFNLQELQTVQSHGLPLKLFVFNNEGYGMIRVSQENLFSSRFTGIGPDSGLGFPDYAKLAELFGFAYVRIDSSSGVQLQLEKALALEGPVLVEVVMSPDQKYLPRVATSKLPDGTLVSPPLEDMDPLIAITDLESLLGYQPQKASFEARGLSYD